VCGHALSRYCRSRPSHWRGSYESSSSPSRRLTHCLAEQWRRRGPSILMRRPCAMSMRLRGQGRATRNLGAKRVAHVAPKQVSSCSLMPWVSEPLTGCVALPKSRSNISLMRAPLRSRRWWKAGRVHAEAILERIAATSDRPGNAQPIRRGEGFVTLLASGHGGENDLTS
jgi:hypothetical protein